MSVTQLAVFIENKPGRLLAATRILGDAGVCIRGYSIADTQDYGILRLLVDQLDVARDTLRANAFTVHESQVILAEVPDAPSGLANVLEGLAGMNVEYTYPTAMQSRIAFGVQDPAAAEAELQRRGVRTYADGDMA